LLAQKLYDDHKAYSEGWNFGPNEKDIRPVSWILDKMISYWPNASWSLDDNVNPHEASFLKLNISKASELLGWTPTWDLEMTLGSIIRWHKLWLGDADMQKVCITEIDNFTKDMNK